MKPNILIVLADQQRYDTIGELGFNHMITPNFDRLAKEGCSFTYAHSHNPVCMPARHDLLTGMTGRAHGYFQNAGGKPMKDYGIPTLPRILSQNGYRTASIGKMHFFPVKEHHGYGDRLTMEEIPKLLEDDDYAMFLKANGDGHVQNIHGVRPLAYHTPQQSLVKDENYETAWVENQTINWLEQNGDNPFFLFVGYIKPHPPWNIPAKYQGIYQDAAIPAAIPKARYYPEDPNHNSWYGDDDSNTQLRKHQEAYYTAVSMVDESFGKIIEHLRTTGKLDNTLVIYTSDHGEMLGDRGYYSKSVPYESAVRIPLLVRYPEVFEPGTTNEDFVDLLDILPTCLDVAGVKYPQCDYKLYGSSIADTAVGKNRQIITASNGYINKNRWVMARNKDYKYIYNFNQGYEEMYYLALDPHETNNIIDSLRGGDAYNMLKTAAIAYESAEGPDGAVVNGNFTKSDNQRNVGFENGKYHKWCNDQFQTFQRVDKEEFGSTFVSEIKTALSNKDFSACTVTEIFNHPDWINWFDIGFHKHGKYANWRSELFI